MAYLSVGRIGYLCVVTQMNAGIHLIRPVAWNAFSMLFWVDYLECVRFPVNIVCQNAHS